MKKVVTVIKWIMFSVLLITEFAVLCIGIYLFFINRPQSFEEWFGEGIKGVLYKIVFLIIGLGAFVGFDAMVCRILKLFSLGEEATVASKPVPSLPASEHTAPKAVDEQKATPQQCDIKPKEHSQSVSYQKPKGICRDCIYFQESEGLFRTKYTCGKWSTRDYIKDILTYFYVEPTSSCDSFVKKSTSTDAHFKR